MLDFKPVTIDDKEIIQSFFNQSPFRNCDFSFSNIFSWKHYYNTTFAVENNCLYFRFQLEGELPGYLFPLGEESLSIKIERLQQDAQMRGDVFQLHAITQKMFDLIEKNLPGQFVYEQNRNFFEYLYSSKDLLTLVGKKYQSKRNHINKFKRTYQWEYLPITREIIPDCLALYNRWCQENGGCHEKKSLIEERIATNEVFRNYEALGIIGGALRINGEILAYS